MGAVTAALAAERKPSLADRLSRYATVASPEESATYFKPEDKRWAETLEGEDSPTGRPLIHINDAKFKAAGASDYRDKMAVLESLHLLDEVDPKKYDELYQSAMSSPEYRRWAKRSYIRSVMDPDMPERRGIDDWHRKSRFDQVVGGYVMAGDDSIPTAKNWSRDLPYGAGFSEKLESLKGELEWPPAERFGRR